MTHTKSSGKKTKRQSTKQSTSVPAPPPVTFRVKPRNRSQQRYIQTIDRNDLTFGLGPAGTGKTFLAVAKAVEKYLAGGVSRIILVRPAVEAGERLGYLPGTLQEKIDPYLRPFYDALYELVDRVKVDKMLENNIIEVAPLAFMRGRTLRDAFIIMDEAQNSTDEQMKMFLTRLGEGSKAIVTGDPSQIDLPAPGKSGLLRAVRILQHVEAVGVCEFFEEDVVRHKLVQRIVRAYEGDTRQNREMSPLPPLRHSS